MKRAILALFALSALFAVEAQQVYRTEFSVFDLREGALQNDHARTERHLLFNPKTVEVVDKVEVVGLCLLVNLVLHHLLMSSKFRH